MRRMTLTDAYDGQGKNYFATPHTSLCLNKSQLTVILCVMLIVIDWTHHKCKCVLWSHIADYTTNYYHWQWWTSSKGLWKGSSTFWKQMAFLTIMHSTLASSPGRQTVIHTQRSSYSASTHWICAASIYLRCSLQSQFKCILFPFLQSIHPFTTAPYHCHQHSSVFKPVTFTWHFRPLPWRLDIELTS